MLTLLAVLACGTTRDYPGQAVPGRTTTAHEPRSGEQVTDAPDTSLSRTNEIPMSAPAGTLERSAGNQTLLPPPGAIAVSIVPAGQDMYGTDAAIRTVFLTPTYAWVNVYSLSTTVRGEPVQRGSVVLAYDPDGVLIGRTTVDRDGRFGVMALYMDDPATPVDEGALPGDAVSFQIDGEPAVVVSPDAPVWTANGAVLSLDLVVGGPAN